MHAVKLSWLAATITEGVQHFEALPVHHVDFPVLAVGQVHEALVVVSREGNLPGGAGA